MQQDHFVGILEAYRLFVTQGRQTMTAIIPNSHRDLFVRPLVVTCVTLMPDGHPQATPVWASLKDNQVLINTNETSQKYRNLKADARVTILVVDSENTTRYIEIRGHAVDFAGGADGLAHADTLAKTYAGREYFADMLPPGAVDNARRVRITIEPQHINTSG